jgi:hypothetical protein
VLGKFKGVWSPLDESENYHQNHDEVTHAHTHTHTSAHTHTHAHTYTHTHTHTHTRRGSHGT